MDIDNISGHEFEDLVEKLIKELGFITEERKRSADGGIDIKAINEKPILKGLYIIQCKRYSSTINESIIRDLYGVVTSERANKGILITNSKFSKQAKNFAKNLPIELIDGDELTKLLEKNLDKKFNKTSKEEGMPEECRIVYEYLEPEEKRINKRRRDIINKRIYLEPKFYNNFNAYGSFFQNKTEKIPQLAEVLVNQINNINNIWKSFKENKINYKDVSELKKQCNEIVKTMNFVENEYENLISTNPPENLIGVHKAIINMYNPFFNFFSDFLFRLSLTEIEDIENPKLKKYLTIKNGKKVIDMNLALSFEEEQKTFNIETEKLSKKLSKNNTAKGKNCFIATAVYENIDASEVMKLREWRDNVLSNNLFGKLVINFYYLIGKYLAKFVYKSVILKKVIKYFLDKFINKKLDAK
jgi:HJR/Mrr/RecB family endonuclease